MAVPARTLSPSVEKFTAVTGPSCSASRYTWAKSRGHNLRKPSSEPVTQKVSFTAILLTAIPGPEERKEK